jgi:hypothetical protein
MGYILPVTPLQYADYANRLNQKDPNFAYIEGVQAIEAQNRFYAEVRRQQERLLEEQAQEQKRKKAAPLTPTAASTDEVLMYRPKPMSTAEIVGKGFVINAYA